MSSTRREFIREAAVAGAVLSAATEAGAVRTKSKTPEGEPRCPYFDQPLYCDGLSEDGKPFCKQ